MRRFLLASLLLATACGPGFNPRYKVEKSRIIGAFVAVDSDPIRSTPAPGESATLTLIAADPGAKAGRTYALIACRKGTSNLDIVYCDDPTTFLGTRFVTTLPGAADPKPDPSLTFTVPAEADLAADEDEIWIFGAVCNGGMVRDLIGNPPEPGTDWDACDPAPGVSPQPYGQIISTRLPLERDANDTNHRPTIASLTFDGADWTATPSDDAGETGCIGMGFPEIPAEYPGVPDEDQPRYPIVATALDGDREVYVDELDQSEQVEDLFLRFFITAGKLDATYDAIDDGDPLAEVAFRAPPYAEVDEAGTLVRFFVYLEDTRRASTWVRRAVCITP